MGHLRWEGNERWSSGLLSTHLILFSTGDINTAPAFLFLIFLPADPPLPSLSQLSLRLWVLLCLCMLPLVVKVWPHTSQEKGLSPEWTSMCLSRDENDDNILPQRQQLYTLAWPVGSAGSGVGFTSLWLRKWLVNSLLDVIFSWHRGHLKSLCLVAASKVS